MNDVTKEEMYMIIDDKYNDAYDCRFVTQEEFNQIRKQTKSSIDNHCEHEFKKTLSKSGMYFISMCQKCESEKPWSILDDNQ